MKINIRRMSVSDVPKIAELEKECFSSPWSEKSLCAELDKCDSFFFVLYCDNELCGYIGSNIILDECYIDNVAVFESQRRKGYAKMLVDCVVQNAISKECSFVSLEVRVSNKAAISLYESFEFTVVGQRKRYYDKPIEDGYIMTKYL